MDAAKQITDQLIALAEKVGGQAWPALVQYAFARSVTGTIINVLEIALVAVGMVTGLRIQPFSFVSKLMKENGYGAKPQNVEAGFTIALRCAALVFGTLILLVTVENLGDCLVGIFAPEGLAVKMLLAAK